MGDNQKSKATAAMKGTTLNRLKDQLYSRNMRLLLAMQNHDEEIQEEIKGQMVEVQGEIDRMCLGYGCRNRN